MWRTTLERGLAVERWRSEDAAAAREDARLDAARAPVLAARRAALVRRGAEAARMREGTATPEEVSGRGARLVLEDLAWQGVLAAWAAEDDDRSMRRAGAEGRRCGEIERWLEEDGWSMVGYVPGGGPVQRRSLH